ncbi:TIGR01777 family oxidoreductase [Kutzneria sp. 744]|uniref:TIGR01777 family oxidoreductase n=1 Tax=Kutzneria sp. (strain 744) TaxID=345341 RepID=UPI0004AE3D18|nr:TIGR01777 family oxidoreductase [Kutzneria sp. 744]
MRVLVAGSSGLIGSALLPVLRHAGHEVLRLVRRPASARDERSWDPPAGRIQDGTLDGVDAVLNLCGAGIGDKRWSQARKQTLLDSRVEPTEVLAAAVAEHKIPVLVNASAVGFYGDTGDRTVDESGPKGQGFLADLVHEWESATRPAADAGARVALLRTGLVFAESGGLLGKLKPLVSLMLGGKLGDGRQYWPWISLDDELAAIRFVLEHEDISGPVNLCAPEQLTNAELTKVMGEVMGRPTPWTVPGFALRAVLGEFADEGVLIGQRATPKALLDHGFQFQHETLATALPEVLGQRA